MKVLNLAVAVTLVVLSTAVASATTKSQRHPVQPPTAPTMELNKLHSSSASREGANLYQKSNYRKAAAKFDEALGKQPTDYRAAYMLGMSQLERERWESARDAFRHALELKPDRYTKAHIYNGLAYSYEAVGQTRMAHHHYHLACAANKANAYAQSGAHRTEYHKKGEAHHHPMVKSGNSSQKSSG